LWLCIGGGGVLEAGTVLLILLLVLGGTSHESIMRDSVALTNEAASVFEAVKDRESAKAAAPKLLAIAERAQSLKKRVDELPKLSADEQKKLLDKYLPELLKAGERANRAQNQAQRNSGGEPSFQEAIRKLERLDLR